MRSGGRSLRIQGMLRILPMLLVMGGIFFLSHLPGDAFEFPEFRWSDKFLHTLVYGVLASSVLFVLPVWLKRQRKWMVVLLVIAVCFLYGCSDEVHQSFIPGRFPSIGDVAADTAGALLFCAGWLYLRRKQE